MDQLNAPDKQNQRLDALIKDGLLADFYNSVLSVKTVQSMHTNILQYQLAGRMFQFVTWHAYFVMFMLQGSGLVRLEIPDFDS